MIGKGEHPLSLSYGSTMVSNNTTHHSSAVQRRSCRTLVGHRVARSGIMQRTNRVAHAAAHPNSTPSGPTTEALQRQAELENELQMARDIQQGLLLAAVPHLPGWELSAVSLPARDLGGDLYDFLPLRDGWQGIMIGDVAGKGLPAALQMAVARTVFRHEARCGQSAALTLAAVNRGIISEIPQGMVTMLYAQLHPTRGELQIANAGHTFPLLLNGRVEELEIPGLPLGIDLDIDYDQMSIILEPGDTIVLYSDGVTEAFNSEYEMFGIERLQALLAANEQLKPRALMMRLLQELRTWGISNAQSDDVTIVVLRRRLARLSDELRSIAEDVLGSTNALTFWHEMVLNMHDSRLLDAAADEWSEVLPALARAAQGHFGRGLARELHQQMRLVIEEYR